MKKKNITILALHLNYGGVEKYISSLCKMLENDYNIKIIVTYNNNYKTAFEFSENIEIEYLIDRMPNKKEIFEAIKNKKIFKFFKESLIGLRIIFLKYFRNIKAIRHIDSDIVITTRIFHNKLISKFSDKKLIKIATEHNYHQNDQKYIRKLIKSLNNFDYLITVSKTLCDFYKDRLSCTNVLFIPNVLDYIPLEKSKFKKNNIISIGRLSPEKGFFDLLSIFEKVKKRLDIKLFLIGDGPLKDELQLYIDNHKLSDSVFLTGFLPQEEIKKFMLASKLYVMTSFTESFGLVLIEAMSYGLPCVAFDSASGAKEIIKNNKNGFLVEERNFDKMAETIVKLVENEKQLNEMSGEAVKTSENYSISKIKQKWIKLLQDALEEK